MNQFKIVVGLLLLFYEIKFCDFGDQDCQSNLKPFFGDSVVLFIR